MKRILTTMTASIVMAAAMNATVSADTVNSVDELNDQAIATCGPGNSQAVLDCLVRYGKTDQPAGKASDSREPKEPTETTETGETK